MRKAAVLAVVLWIALVPAVSAQNSLGFQDNLDYDVYIGNPGGETIVIQSVQIIGIRDIADERFLVIRSDKFDAARSEGVVRYSSVLAVLPSYRTTILQKPGVYHKKL